MASELRVDKIIPSSGTSIGIGTASGTIDILGVTVKLIYWGNYCNLIQWLWCKLNQCTSGNINWYISCNQWSELNWYQYSDLIIQV